MQSWFWGRYILAVLVAQVGMLRKVSGEKILPVFGDIARRVVRARAGGVHGLAEGPRGRAADRTVHPGCCEQAVSTGVTWKGPRSWTWSCSTPPLVLRRSLGPRYCRWMRKYQSSPSAFGSGPSPQEDRDFLEVSKPLAPIWNHDAGRLRDAVL